MESDYKIVALIESDVDCEIKFMVDRVTEPKRFAKWDDRYQKSTFTHIKKGINEIVIPIDNEIPAHLRCISIYGQDLKM